ncbi:hypothetical protein V6Z12_D03G058300 [Gossypium hirsutum]
MFRFSLFLILNLYLFNFKSCSSIKIAQNDRLS